ncbi:uncharacterized protein LOC128235310 [Mya arenaria]|uniref:uncharacterized protein LOC128235310 n=1 Tax=Mya arenaria TaxID=6604 RepID=UPI0022E2055C|nr:uncharacterized protein LOC128235310 [Mya arenaria]
MVLKCSIYGCNHRKDREKDLQYYRLPAVITNQGAEWEKLTADRRREWLARINQDFSTKNLTNVRICSTHFISGKKADLHDRLNPDWAPSIGLRGAQILAEPEETPSVSRYNRIKNRTQRRLYSEEIRGDEIDSVIEDFDDVNVNSKFVSTGV